MNYNNVRHVIYKLIKKGAIIKKRGDYKNGVLLTPVKRFGEDYLTMLDLDNLLKNVQRKEKESNKEKEKKILS